MRFIVTGGAGFIGANIVAALNRLGHSDVLVVDRLDHAEKEANLAPLRYARLQDIADFRADVRADRAPHPTTVFHMGACSSTTVTDEAFVTDNNFHYTRELCEWALRHNARFIYASSAATYGDGARGYSDDDTVTPTLQPLNLYGRSKQMFDMWALARGLFSRIVGLKYFNVYGPREDHKGDMRSVANKAFRQILDTGELQLFKSHRPPWKDGEQERDFVFVADAVNVTLFFHDRPDVSGLFNCGTGRARTWLDLARAVFAAMDQPPRIVFVDMPENIRDKYQYHTQADTAKLRRAGYTAPFTPLEDGVRLYIRDHLLPRAGQAPTEPRPPAT